MATTIRKYIKYLVVSLRILGLWTEEDRIFGTKYYWIYHLFVNVFCIGLFNATQLIYLVSAINDLEKLSTTAYLFLSCAMANVKTYYYCQHFALLKSILGRLDQEDFQPRNERQRRKVRGFMKTHVMCQVIYLVCYCLTMPIWLLSPLILSKEIALPFKAWYPFDEQSNSALFILAYIHQSIAMIYIALTNLLVDLVTLGLIAYARVECDILEDILVHLYEFTKERMEDEGAKDVQYHMVKKEMNKTLLSCVNLHWKILELAKDTNTIFNVYIFIMFANSLLAICMTMLQITSARLRSTEVFALGLYQMAILSELLMHCWFGNELIAKSERIDFALYQSDWVDCPRVFKKNMAFFMMRTGQRPIRMFGVNFFVLSLATFTYILRASWSFFAMLNQLRRKNT